MVSMSIAFAIQRLSCVNGYIFFPHCNQCLPPGPGPTGPHGKNGHKAITTPLNVYFTLPNYEHFLDDFGDAGSPGKHAHLLKSSTQNKQSL